MWERHVLLFKNINIAFRLNFRNSGIQESAGFPANCKMILLDVLLKSSGIFSAYRLVDATLARVAEGRGE